MKLIAEAVTEYINAFQSKKLLDLTELYSDNIILDEWGTIFDGKQEVLDSNTALFDTYEKIKVYPINMWPNDDLRNCVVELEIMMWENINDPVAQSIPVIDIITFDDSDKISSIRAFRGI